MSLLLSVTLAWAENPCAELGSRLLNPTRKEDWACLRFQSENGSPQSQYFVGRMLLSGNSPDGYQAEQGIALLEKAGRKNDASAQKDLSEFYFAGKHVGKDIAMAYRWYVLAHKHPRYSKVEWIPQFETLLSAEERKNLATEAEQILAGPAK